MAPDDLVQTPIQNCGINLPEETHRGRYVVSHQPRFQLVQKPETLLCKGQRHWSIPAAGPDCLFVSLAGCTTRQPFFEQRALGRR
jgi:hypothetical protein